MYITLYIVANIQLDVSSTWLIGLGASGWRHLCLAGAVQIARGSAHEKPQMQTSKSTEIHGFSWDGYIHMLYHIFYTIQNVENQHRPANLLSNSFLRIFCWTPSLWHVSKSLATSISYQFAVVDQTLDQFHKDCQHAKWSRLVMSSQAQTTPHYFAASQKSCKLCQLRQARKLRSFCSPVKFRTHKALAGTLTTVSFTQCSKSLQMPTVLRSSWSWRSEMLPRRSQWLTQHHPALHNGPAMPNLRASLTPAGTHRYVLLEMHFLFYTAAEKNITLVLWLPNA
jgi:hypothetical protein